VQITAGGVDLNPDEEPDLERDPSSKSIKSKATIEKGSDDENDDEGIRNAVL
jgi:hypothetical protein